MTASSVSVAAWRPRSRHTSSAWKRKRRCARASKGIGRAITPTALWAQVKFGADDRTPEIRVRTEGREGLIRGLAIVRRGLQRIGGECGVESRAEGGSASWIDVPKEPRAS